MAMERNAIIITIRNPEEKRVKKEKERNIVLRLNNNNDDYEANIYLLFQY